MIIDRRDARSLVPYRGAARIAAVFLCLGLFTGPGLPGAMAAPILARQSYSISEFDMVRLDAPVEVIVTTGKGTSAAATGDRDTLDQLDLQVNSRTLVIRMRSGLSLGGSGNGGKARLPTRITLTTGELHHLAVTGAGNLTADRLKGARVDAALSGSGRLTVTIVQADRIDATLFGSGTMTLAGSTLDLMAAVSGSGRMDASALVARRVKVETEGSADARMTAQETAAVSANGSGELAIAGKAVCTVRKVGSASVSCGSQVY